MARPKTTTKPAAGKPAPAKAAPPKPGRGGKREGAGAKPKIERFASEITQAQQVLASRLVEIAEAAVEAALGGTRVDTREQMVCTLMRRGIVRDASGNIWLDEKGKPAYEQVPLDLGPEFKPTDLVLVERRESSMPPDALAGDRLMSRLMGLPAAEQADEAEKLDTGEALDEAERLAGEYRDPDEAGEAGDD